MRSTPIPCGFRRRALATLLAPMFLLVACIEPGPVPEEIPPAPPRPHDTRTFSIPDGQAAFEPLEGATAFHGVGEGIHGPASYRIEVPENWNGVLVMYAHGYRGTGDQLTVGNPALRGYLIDNGFAWAASSYSANYYDVRAGVEDTNALALAFQEITGHPAPTKYYITGHSMGGHVTGAAIEEETLATALHRVRYAGAVPMCGVMGDNELYDYFLAYNLAAHHLAGMPVATFPIPDHEEKLPAIRAALWEDYAADMAAMTDQGEPLWYALMHLSGGPRPIFEGSFPNFQDLLLGYGTMDGAWRGVLSGVSVNTTGIVYQLDADPALSEAERAFNEAIFRVEGDLESANPIRPDGVRALPIVAGRFDIPVVSIHTLGDLFVPFRVQQLYAERAAANGNADRLVQRAIRGPAHCGFDVQEEIAAFEAMVHWEEDGVRPTGDDVLDPEVVAEPRYGCQFTVATRPGLPAC
ncbi:MAG: alpha/beta hydrolase [Gemmatimonadota bacterium]